MSRENESLRAVRTAGTGVRTIDSKFQYSSSAPAEKQEACALVRPALRAVLGRLGQASVPLIQSFSVQALHRRTRDGPPYRRKSRRLEP